MFLRDQEPVLRKELGKGVEMSGCFYPFPPFLYFGFSSLLPLLIS